jgi:hypothetical protein
MTNSSLLLLVVLLTGCASRTWTEQTDTTRASGPTRDVVEDRPKAGQFFEVRTDVEVDGFNHHDTYTADETGRIDIELLAPALQCLHYAHDVKLDLWSFTEEKIVYSRIVDATAAHEVIREYSIQARLGAKLLLRQAAADILDKLIDSTTDEALQEQLDAIRVKVQLRPSWE